MTKNGAVKREVHALAKSVQDNAISPDAFSKAVLGMIGNTLNTGQHMSVEQLLYSLDETATAPDKTPQGQNPPPRGRAARPHNQR